MRFHCWTQVNKDTTSQPVKQVHYPSGSSVLHFFGPPEEMSGSSLVGIRSFKGNEFDIDSPQSLWLSSNGGRLASGGYAMAKQKKRAKKWLFARWFQVPFFGMVNRDLFQRLSDLQLGDEKVILNHLLFITLLHVFIVFFGWGEKVQLEKHTVGLSNRHTFIQIQISEQYFRGLPVARDRTLPLFLC